MIFLLIDLLRLTHLVDLDKFLFGNWVTFGVVTGIVAVIMTWGYFRYTNKERVELSITVDKNMETKEPLKIVAISDLHLGFSIGKKEFEQWVELINKENPDIVLIAGDIIDNHIKPLLEQDFASSFRKIKSKYGTYAAVGNHEYITGNILKAIDFLHHSGVTVLKDSVALINDEFYIVGRDDRMNPDRKTVEELTNSLDHSKPIILLDHQPFNLENVEKNNIDLQI
jgi:predicted MPP superfamily phosphohydrolase